MEESYRSNKDVQAAPFMLAMKEAIEMERELKAKAVSE